MSHTRKCIVVGAIALAIVLPAAARAVTSAEQLRAQIQAEVNAFVGQVTATTSPADIQALIDTLNAAVQQLKSKVVVITNQIPATRPALSGGRFCQAFSRNMGRGSTDGTTGGEVTKLQQLLAQDSSIYPEGLVTGFFGSATENAVQRAQKKAGIVSSGTPDTTGFGFVGPATRGFFYSRWCNDSGSVLFTIPGSVTLAPGQTGAQSQYGGLSILLNSIKGDTTGSNSSSSSGVADITLNFKPICDPETACALFMLAPLEVGLGSAMLSVNYAGFNISLTALTASAATFMMTSAPTGPTDTPSIIV